MTADKTDVNIIDEIHNTYEAFLPVQGRYHEHLYSLLELIFRAAPEIEKNGPMRQQVMGKCAEKGIGDLKKFVLEETEPFNLILIMLLGRNEKTKATKSQWLKVLRLGKFKQVSTEEGAFSEWLRDAGGIVRALKDDVEVERDEEQGFSSSASEASDRGAGSAAALISVAPKPSYEQLLRAVQAKAADAETISINLDPVHELHNDISILVACRMPGTSPAEMRVPLKLADESVIKYVLSAAARGKGANLTEEERQEKVKQAHLWALNRVALKIAKRIAGKVLFNDLMAFIKSVRALDKADELNRKLFSGPAGFGGFVDDLSEVYTFEVLNPEFNVLDPGRYIRSARKDALVPYDLSLVDGPDGDKVISAYVKRNTNPEGFDLG